MKISAWTRIILAESLFYPLHLRNFARAAKWLFCLLKTQNSPPSTSLSDALPWFVFLCRRLKRQRRGRWRRWAKLRRREMIIITIIIITAAAATTTFVEVNDKVGRNVAWPAHQVQSGLAPAGANTCVKKRQMLRYLERGQQRVMISLATQQASQSERPHTIGQRGFNWIESYWIELISALIRRSDKIDVTQLWGANSLVRYQTLAHPCEVCSKF